MTNFYDNEYFNDIKQDETFKSIFAEIIAYPMYGISSQLVIKNLNKTFYPIQIKWNQMSYTDIGFKQKQMLLVKSGICINLLQKLLCNYSNNYKKIIQNVKSIVSQRHYKGKGEYFYKESIKCFTNNNIDSYKTGIELLCKATLLTHYDAMLKLAYLLNNERFNNKLSFQLYSILALKGITEAEYNISFMFNDLPQQIEYLTIAANKGYCVAQSQLGSMYEKGCGVERDIDKSVEWYTLAGQNGCGYSYYCIGRIYDFGFTDVIVDKEKALKYYKLAMETDIYFTCYYDKLMNE